MPDNRQVHKNVVSNQSSDNVEEAILRLKINDNDQEVGVSKSGSYPDRPGEPDCSYYLRTGSCGYGSNCRFNHPAYDAQGRQIGQYQEELPERVGQPDCGYFLKTGTCKYGSTCKYHHPKDRNGAGPVTFNIIGLPMRQDEKPCPYFMRTGSCKFRVACKFHHPQPASTGAGLPVNGPVGSAGLPPTGVPYAGGLPTWSLPRASFGSGPRLQTQSYMPVFAPQNIIPANGWSTYIGNMNPVFSAGILGSSYAYNPTNPSESGSSGQMVLSSSASNYPERPDQPECRYYMNTGTCKYGSDCKYHHPGERIGNSAVNSVGPLGLPSRPGQAACSSYTLYGLCKYGPTCRFDHPYLGYPYNYPLSVPLSMFDTSLLTYQKMSPTAQLSEAPLPSRLPDWARDTDPASKKHQNLETKNSDEPVEEVASPPHSLQSSSKTTHDQN